MTLKRKNKVLLIIIGTAALVVTAEFFLYKTIFYKFLSNIAPSSTPLSTTTPPKNFNDFHPTPSPTPRPLTFEELNNLYGPCAHLPVLFYHHIEDPDIAKLRGYQALNVTIDAFKNQMSYLKDKGYQILNVSSLINFFDSGGGVGRGSALLTFDDGYEDFYLHAYPILKSLGFQSILFLPTGLVGNPGYLTWDQIKEMSSSGLVYFANHTWSHYAATGSPAKVREEITLADGQLNANGLNNLKVFAYPYGNAVPWVQDYLSSLGYKVAFSTTPGSILCKKQRFELPRLRIGNASLAAYGF